MTCGGFPDSSFSLHMSNIGALVIRIGLWGVLYDTDSKEASPKGSFFIYAYAAVLYPDPGQPTFPTNGTARSLSTAGQLPLERTTKTTTNHSALLLKAVHCYTHPLSCGWCSATPRVWRAHLSEGKTCSKSSLDRLLEGQE